MSTHQDDGLFAESWRRELERRREAQGLVPAGWNEPVYFEDYLVEVWRLASVGREDDARRMLGGIWSWAMDGMRSERDVRVALRLLDRLGFVTDDAEGWAALPDDFVIFRAESDTGDPTRGLCWTLSAETAETHAERHGLSVSRGQVAKADVLAYITQYGEDEIVVRRDRVKAA